MCIDEFQVITCSSGNSRRHRRRKDKASRLVAQKFNQLTFTSDKSAFGLTLTNENPLFNVPATVATVYNDSVLVLSCQPNDLLKKQTEILGFYGEESGWASLFDGLKPADNPVLLLVTLDINRM